MNTVYDPSLIAGVTCVLVEPVPNDETSLTVTGDGIFSERDGGTELRDILAQTGLPWEHDVINRGRGLTWWLLDEEVTEVMGWRVTLAIKEFLRVTAPYRTGCSARLDEWFKEIGKYRDPIKLTIMCSKKFWTVFDHLKGDYQKRAGEWASTCFGPMVAIDCFHRRNRFIEEAIELHQASRGTVDEIIQLVKHVYNKPAGDPHQEVGGTMVTLATLCNALGVDLLHAGEDELARVWEEFPRIRAKQASAQEGSPLPGDLNVPLPGIEDVSSARSACGSEKASLERKILEWIATGSVGASSKAMALAACGIRSRADHPHDPSDFNRCLQLLDAVPEIRSHFNQVAALSSVWKRLITEWDELEECFITEAGPNWSKARSAPKTYEALAKVVRHIMDTT